MTKKREDFGGAYWTRARCGDRVFDVFEPRHIARLNGISGNTAFVKFQNGWRGEIELQNLRKAEDEPLTDAQTAAMEALKVFADYMGLTPAQILHDLAEARERRAA